MALKKSLAWLPLSLLLLAGCGGGSGSATQTTAPVTSTATTTTATGTIPAAPTGTAVAAGTNQETISWSPVTGATSYNIYWTNDPSHVMKDMGANKIAGVTSPYHHTGLTAGSVYAYVVTSVNAAGESNESDIASATTPSLDGLALYTAKCSGCHNPLAISEKKGRTLAQIQAAIAANKGGMSSLSSLTSVQIQAISDVLAF